MSSVDRSSIESALLKKGFQLVEGDHRFYYYKYKGLLTSIRTKISMGSSYKTYNDSLLSQIKKQLKFKNKNQLVEFINCPFTAENYLSLLKEARHLPPD